MLFSARAALKDLYIADELVYCRPLLIAVKDGFDKRFGHLMQLNSRFEMASPKAVPLFLAMLPNPEFKMNFITKDWFDSNAEGLNQIKSLLLNAMKEVLKYNNQLDEKKTNDSNSNNATNNKTVKKGNYKFIKKISTAYYYYLQFVLCIYFHSFLYLMCRTICYVIVGLLREFDHSQMLYQEFTQNPPLVAELSGYLRAPKISYKTKNHDFERLQYLNDYPVVKELYLKYNCMFATEADVERVFSFAGS